MMDFDNTFKDHVAKREEFSGKEFLMWRNSNGSSNYAIFYVRVWGMLMVFGDCYEATYQWNFEEGFNLTSIAKFDLGYFTSKCRASPHGRDPFIWDGQAWSERQLACCLYWQGTARKALRELLRWFLHRSGKGLCVIACPEAAGVNITATMKSIGVELEWPPRTVTYQVVLAGTPK